MAIALPSLLINPLQDGQPSWKQMRRFLYQLGHRSSLLHSAIFFD
ncbi:hypothetical protein O77CONTIG1_02627 [Leptolyngbya sp. O-77]|nr:hypothetical protein O77CONTIG1_02627 [Leptolyngbya sp. O-77]